MNALVIPSGRAVCPKCGGSGRMPVPEASRKYADIIAGYDKASDTFACDNCGGQTMSGRALGHVKIDASGSGCLHEYKGEKRGNCYYVYRCQKCGDSYDIDSGD